MPIYRFKRRSRRWFRISLDEIKANFRPWRSPRVFFCYIRKSINYKCVFAPILLQPLCARARCGTWQQVEASVRKRTLCFSRLVKESCCSRIHKLHPLNPLNSGLSLDHHGRETVPRLNAQLVHWLTRVSISCPWKSQSVRKEEFSEPTWQKTALTWFILMFLIQSFYLNVYLVSQNMLGFFFYQYNPTNLRPDWIKDFFPQFLCKRIHLKTEFYTRENNVRASRPGTGGGFPAERFNFRQHVAPKWKNS